MHKNILTQPQLKLLPFVKLFSSKYYLVGGTAIALQIGHRRSIDFDLFTPDPVNNNHIRKLIKENKLNIQIRYEDPEQITGTINQVQFTWIQYPYSIITNEKLTGIIKMPNLLTLAAMKVFALGKRAKWKDYVDVYFILTKYHSLQEVSLQAQKIYGTEFNEKLLRQQLCYYKDINYTEKVDYVTNRVSDTQIKKTLTDIAIQKM